jgi:type VI secretion system protein ImpM
MPYGLFGKLPSRRDFISQNMPRSFLRVWEPWLELGMRESQDVLGRLAWEDCFRAAPIWRFWLGAEICGEAILGAFMPSIDAVGRYFPLTLIYLEDARQDSNDQDSNDRDSNDKGLPPPSIDPRHAWFEALEDILLSALDPEASPETLLDDLARLTSEPVEATAQKAPLFATLQQDRASLPLTDLFEACRLAYHDCKTASATFWWTLGGDGFRPTAFMHKDLPEARLLTGMLSGQFEPQEQNQIEQLKTAIGVKPS